ncbi:MAG: T9SS type A sorting domain-containing protein [Flavobacteriales bacterium]|nr:T9SS type A sorting domain-containing protein [Flavobacteriales bacterium]
MGAPGPLYNATDATNNTNAVAYMNSDIPAASFSGPGPFTLTFQWMCMGGSVAAEGGARLIYSVNSGANWFEVPTIYNGSNSVNTASVILNSLAGFVPGTTPIRFGFRWFNFIGSGTHNDPPMIVDNMQVSAPSQQVNTITTTGIQPSSVCAGSTVQITFTSTGTFNPGNVYTAQLSDASGSFSNPVNIGTLSSTANAGTINAVIPPGTPPGTGYQVQILSSDPAVTGSAGSVTLTVLPAVTPSLTLNTNPPLPVCTGQPVTVVSSVNGGGPTPTFSWTVNGLPQPGNSSSFTLSNPQNGDVVAVTMTSSDPCASPQQATQSITISVTNASAPQVSISASPDTVICPGESVTFTPAPVNGGSSPSYQWFLNGNPVSTAPTFTSSSLADLDEVWVVMTSSSACANPQTATSNTLTIYHSQAVTPSVTVTANPGTTICAGDNVTFSAVPVNGGNAPTYQWMVNGSPVGSGPTYFTNTLQNGDQVTVMMTSSSPCANPTNATSPPLIINVTTGSGSQPSVTVTASPGTTLCQGQSVTFTATVQNGGSNPSFQWQVNGANVGSNQATFTTSALQNGDQVTVVVTAQGGSCGGGTATSQPITVNVTSSVVPTVTINSVPTGSICSGTLVTFTATPSNGGNTPSYQWFINGNLQPGNQATFSSSSLANNDVVTCVMTSSASCAVPQTASSNPIQMSVQPSITPTVTITAQPQGPVCPNEQITFTATHTGGGTLPLFTWNVNGQPAGNNSTFVYQNPQNGAQVTCTLVSNDACANPSTVTSSPFNVVTHPAYNGSITMNAMGSLEVPPCVGCTYQWFLNGNPISGANSNTYKPTQAGVYTVVVTSPQGCTFTTPQYISNFSVENTDSDLEVQIFPNPFSEALYLSGQGLLLTRYVKIRNIQGALIQAIPVMGKTALELPASHLPAGVYILELETPFKTLLHKIIKN